MNRRSVLVLMAAGSLLGTRLAPAQPPQKVYRIGFVANTMVNAELIERRSTHPAQRIIEAGLRELGWVEGKNVQLLWKSAEGRYERRPGIIEEFVRMPVDVLVVFNNESSRIALQKTRTIPIVATGGFFVEQGLVASLARPGGNLTGLSWEFRGSQGKLLQLLKGAAPRTTRVAFIARVGHGDFHPETLQAATDLGLTIFNVRFEGAEFERAVEEAVRQGANALVFRGTPHELPIEQVDKLELHLNLVTAKELGLTFPASLITQADRVFQ